MHSLKLSSLTLYPFITRKSLPNKYGFEILTTNLLHGEYGPKDDYITIINSLKPTERYDNDKKLTP